MIDQGLLMFSQLSVTINVTVEKIFSRRAAAEKTADYFPAAHYTWRGVARAVRQEGAGCGEEEWLN